MCMYKGTKSRKAEKNKTEKEQKEDKIGRKQHDKGTKKKT